ncbi:hypothetical protein JYT15_00955 [Acidimicrobium ferrooxidans]|nr:hypothetical protein [Acidimicrobium ferrooxidans]
MRAQDAETTTIYVALLDEGVDCWRPVQAEHRGGDVYRIVGQPYDRSDEWWRFGHGDSVFCEMRELSEGRVLVATHCCASPEEVMFAEAWVQPLYLKILHTNYLSLPEEELSDFVRDASVILSQVTDEVLDVLLADHTPGGWRERLMGGWLVGVLKHEKYIDRIGELLLSQQYHLEEQGHSFALAAIGTESCLSWLNLVVEQGEPPREAVVAKAWLAGGIWPEAHLEPCKRFDLVMQFCDRWFWSGGES